MKSLLLNFSLLLVIVALPKALLSQCGGGPCPPGGAQSTQSVASGCVAINEGELDCASGTMPTSPSPDQPSQWCSTVENNLFYPFTASASSVAFEIAAFDCQGGTGALQAALLDCSLNWVSDCFGNIPSGSSITLVNTTPLVPGTVYLLMLDGGAGAICDYVINGAIPAEPTGNNICVGGNTGNNQGIYTSNQAGNWTINPPNAGTIIGPSMGTSVTVNWNLPGTHEICLSVCPNGNSSCLTVEVGENILINNPPELVCLDQSATCGNTAFYASAPGTYTVEDAQPNGECETITTCTYNVPPMGVGTFQHAMCLGDFYFICGVAQSGTQIGYQEICQGPNGCDSLVTGTLIEMDPTVIIADPTVIGCGASFLAILNAAGSPDWVGVFYDNTTLLWTGPGTIPNPSSPVIEVTVPGEYCFTITHTTFGISCTDTDCVTVESETVPNPPSLTGPTVVCGGNATYTVSPSPTGPLPTGYTWTVPAGVTFTNQGNFSIVVNWAGSSGGQVCVTANNFCGPSTPTCINVTVGNGPAVPVVTGPASVCAGTTQTYTITNPSPGATCTWTVPAGASATAGPNGTTVMVDFTGASSGNVCATCMDNCGTAGPTCVAVTVNTPPAAPVFTSGPNQVCAADMATYCVNADPNATSWSWTSPAGNFPNSTSNCLDINWAGLNGGNICVTANNNCGSSPQTCFNVAIIPSPTAAISGQGAFCQNSGGSVDLSIALTGTAPWTVTYTINNGSPIVIPNIQTSPYILNATTPGTYQLLTVTDGGICQGTVSGTATVTEHPLPTATLSGAGNICLGSGNQANLTITLTGAAPWQVVFVGGNGNNQTLSINASPFNLPIGQGNAGLIQLVSVQDNNGCIGTVSGTSQVNVLDAPTTSVTTECNATNTQFVVTITISNGDPATYSVTPANGTLAGNVFTSNPIPSGSGYSFVVTDMNNCSPSTVSDNIVVCDCATQVGTMDNATLSDCGDGPITAFQYDDTNQVLDGDDVQMYVLHSGNSASIVDPIILVTPNASVSFNPATMSYGTVYYFSAVVGNGGGPQGIDLDDPCLQVAQGTPVVFYEIPTASIAGSTEICIGESTDLTISATGIAPWIVTINGQQFSVVASPSVQTVSPMVTTDYVLSAVEDANCPNAANGTATVTVNTSPEVINVTTTCNGLGTAYRVSFEITGGDPTCYTVTPADGTLTGNVFTSNEIPSGQGYYFEVTDCNGCPADIVESPLVDCNCLSTAGNLNADELDVCGDEVVPLFYDDTGEFLDADDALCYILHGGDPQSPIVTNSVPVFSFDPTLMTTGGTQYFICPVVGNDDGNGCVDLSDPCLSIGGCTIVRFRGIPTATLVSGDNICEGETGQLTIEFTGTGPWDFVVRDDNNNETALQATSSPYLMDVSPGSTLGYTLVSMEGRFCPGTVNGSQIVQVNQAPVANVLSLDCNAAATAYTLTIEISGGDAASYAVVPANGTLSGNIFTSNAYPNFGTYEFTIDDQNGCGPVILEGGFSCDCITDAGDMPNQQLNYCIGDVIAGSVTVGEMLDADDILLYVLHTGSGVSLGTVIATNTSPNFTFNPATMQTGVTYYLSAIAGNGLPNAMIDLSDFCLSIAAGTPVLFNDLPTASIAGDATICNGETTDVTFTLTGNGPFAVEYAIDGVPQTPQIVPTPGAFDLPLSPTQTVTYTITGVTDQGTGCANAATGEIEIVVNQIVEAGFASGDFEFCDNVSSTINLFEKLLGYDDGGVWTDATGNVYPNGGLNVTPLNPGTYTYTYTVSALAPCPDDFATMNVIIRPAPVADAGSDVTFICSTLSLNIGGTGTTPGMSYAWEGGTVSNPMIASPSITEAGEYILTVTTPFNCVDRDTMYAFVSNEKPNPIIESSPVKCFGQNNGVLQVVDVEGGLPPYSYSFNGGPYTSNSVLFNLAPGSYSIQVKDSGGCESDLATIMITEPPLVTVDVIPSLESVPPVADYNAPFVIEIVTSPPFAEMDTVIWTHAGGFNDSLFCSNCQSNEVALEYQTTFTVTVDENGCQDEESLTVFVRRDHLIYVPNAFSPNGLDADLNERFRLFGGENIVKVNSLLVFNRWGEAVYEIYDYDYVPNDPTFGWDGTHRGEKMNPGVFAWTAEVLFEDNVVRQYKGDVTLMR